MLNKLDPRVKELMDQDEKEFPNLIRRMKREIGEAKIIGDLSYQKVFKFDVDDKKLGPTQKELIIQRKTNL